MNLLDCVKNIILEFRGRTFYLPNIVKGNRTLSVGVSDEQMNRRSGRYNPNEPENFNIMRSIMSGNWKSGVYNMWLWDIIERNFDDVYNTIDRFYDFESDRNRVIFYGYNEIVGDVEFVADIEARGIGDMALKIITSGVSLPNKNFFKNRDNDPTIRLIEGKKIEIFHRIFLEN
jgi:hypothetical protein